MYVYFDRSRYLVIPRTNGRRLLALARLLLKYMPPNPTVAVTKMAAALQQEVLRVAQGFVARYREYGPKLAAEESELDALVDVLLHIFRDRLANWQAFEREGVRRLAAIQAPNTFDFAALIERAGTARRAFDLLFARGLEFTQLPYLEQAEHMLMLDKLIEEEGITEELDALVGQPFLAALRECSQHYRAMVDKRSARIQGSTVNLRTLNSQLQRAIQNYMIATLAMYDDDDPEGNVDVKLALRPYDALREQLQRERSRAAGGDEELVEDEDAEGIEELIDEQQAVDTELGLPDGSEPDSAELVDP